MHESHKIPVSSCLIAIVVVLGLGSPSAQALEITLDRPGDREFIRDLAGMIDPSDEATIRELCDRLLTEKATPIIVVTIESMAQHGGAGMRIETFATLLFNQWQIGHEKLGQEAWNTGILLLVSKGDRKARIELGAGWGHEEDAQCQRIMDEYIVAQFKQEKFSAGIRDGVAALDKMARYLELPSRPRPWWHYAIIAGSLALAVFTFVSLYRRGASGWAWLFWAAIFAAIGTFLYYALIKGDSGRGGFSGGSFGGGFSGGGGATGSW